MKQNIILALLCFSSSVFGAAPQGDADFNGLLKQFPKGNLPFAITLETLKKDLLVRNGVEKEDTKLAKVKRTRIGRQYHQLLPDMAPFSRVPIMPEAVVALKSATHHALVYTFGRYDVEYRVAIYNQNGDFLFKQTIASADNDKIQELWMDKDLKANLTTHQIVWAKDYEKEGFEKNKIQSIQVEKKEVVDLTKTSHPIQNKNNNKKRISPKAPILIEKEPKVIRA